MTHERRIAGVNLLAAALAALAAVTPALAATRDGAAEPPCRVEISVEPREAQVTVGHRPIAELPGCAAVEPGRWEARLAPGSYVVGFSAPGYDAEFAPLRIRQGDAVAAVARSLTRTTGLVLFRSEPAGAEITIDGVSYGQTPRLVTDLPLGTWQATFSLPGHRTQTLRFTIADRTPARIEANLSPDTATLEVTADIDGVEVKVNGIPRGQAPCSVAKVPAGDFTLEAKAAGYRDYIQSGRVGEAETLAIAVRMEPLPASLKVHSLPDGARVYLDNAFSGETPFSTDTLAPGEHRVRVEKDGFDPMARTVTLDRGESSVEEFRLKSNTGALSLTSTPEGVAVFVDGVRRGETPPGESRDVSGILEIDGIPAGEHTLKFSKPGYFDKTEPCAVARGETTLHRVALTRRFIPDYEVVTESGSHKGVLVGITETAVRIETSPRVAITYPLDKVISHGPLK